MRLMNAFGPDRARHTIVSGMEGQYGARDAIAPGIDYEIAQNPPPLTGRPSVDAVRGDRGVYAALRSGAEL